MSKMFNYTNVVAAKEKTTNHSPLHDAFKSFENRVGVSYKAITTSEDARKMARDNLDKETIRLRKQYKL